MRRTQYIGAGIFILSVVFGIFSCSPKLSYTPYQTELLMPRSSSDSYRGEKCCREESNYPPDTNYTHKIRVVFHYMYDSLGQGNLPKDEAVKYAKTLIKACNDDLHRSIAPALFNDQPLPGLPKGYEFVLSPATNEPDDIGVYFHNDQDLYAFVAYGKNKNNYDRQVIRKYQTESDSFLNIFMMPHHPDSVASPTYKPRRNGIALGYSVKVAGYFSQKHSPYHFKGIVNHEIGHILGLSHTWSSNDGCDDTPKHSNCWVKSDEPPCDTAYSNNMMDYNAWQNSLTPCQISRINRSLTRWRSRQRHMVIPDWCRKTDTIMIRDSIVWEGEKDLSSDIIIHPGATLVIKCRTSLPEKGFIKVLPDARLILDNCWLHNSCGDMWLGIQIGERGDRKGLVLTVGDVIIDNITDDDEITN